MGHHCVVLIPSYNDWEALSLLLPSLDEALESGGRQAELVIVDDGSTIERGSDFGVGPWKAIRKVGVLRLLRNLGHQRAIAVGLGYTAEHIRPLAVVVMDSDGEDDPVDVPRLLDRMDTEGQTKIVFAERTKRSETLRFRIGYGVYRSLHRLLTGVSVRVGNFSAIPAKRLASLVVVSELWSHYAAGVFRSRQPFCTIPTHRAKRLCGRSTMNYIALVTHGLSAISVFSDVAGVRLIAMAATSAVMAVICLLGVLLVRLTTDFAIPGWATYSVGLLLNLILQTIILMVIYSFVILSGRQGLGFLPRRDYAYFVDEMCPIASSEPLVRAGEAS